MSPLVEYFFQRSLEEPLARHVRAVERWLIVESRIPLDRIYVEPDADLAVGDARLLIVGGGSCVMTAYIVYGTKGRQVWTRDPGPTVRESEWHHRPCPRLAIAHELAHLALGHCFTDRPGELRPPDGNGFTEEQDWEASAYATKLLQLSSEYLDERHKLLVMTPKAMLRALKNTWPKFWKQVQTQRYLRFIPKEPLPFGSLDPDFLEQNRRPG